MIKVKTCKVCKKGFFPLRPMQTVCTVSCASQLSILQAQKKLLKAKKEEKKKDKERLDKLKTTRDLCKEVQFWANKLVRLRDKHQGCISCDRPASWDGQWHASHFKSVGANSALRFNLWNIHKACSICNNHLSGNIAEYSRRLPLRIGQDKYDWLNNHPRVRKYDRDYLVRLKRVFQKMCKRQERRNEQDDRS